MKNTESKTTKTILGALAGFCGGVLFQIAVLSQFFGQWPLRSFIVASAVTGIAWAAAGGVIGRNSGKKTTEEKAQKS